MRILVVWLINTLYTEHFIQVLENSPTDREGQRGAQAGTRDKGDISSHFSHCSQEISGPDMATS